MDEERPEAEAFAVSDGVFTFVGTGEEAREYARRLELEGKSAILTDLAGKSVLPAFQDSLTSALAAHVELVSVLASQVISNVPAALLLSGFTEEALPLLIGVNLGGLGTLIASMASLISYKQINREYSRLRGQYLLSFTLWNLALLAALLLLRLALT